MPKPWHAMSTEETLDSLSVKENGLSQEEAQNRLHQYGPNELKKEKGTSPIRIFFEQFTDILMVILLIAVGLTIGSYFIKQDIGELYDATVIIAIVLATATLGFFEEYRSEKAVEALKRMTAPTAVVLRGGKEVKVPAVDIVPGDIVLLYTGDKVPADSRLIETFNLKVDEAALTGESTPVNKNANVLPDKTSLNDMKNMVFTGTIIVYGRGKALVTSTGMKTEFGKVDKMVQTTGDETTTLEKR